MKLEVSPAGGGSIKINGAIPNSYPATGVFYGRGIANLEAVPAPGYSFAEWSGELSGTNNPVSITLSHDAVITAYFTPVQHTISIQVEGNGATEPAVGSYQYNEGDSVSITAIPDDGWQFAGWSGDADGTESAQTQVTVTSDKVVTAHFSRVIPEWWQALRTFCGGIMTMFVPPPRIFEPGAAQ